MPIPSRLPQRAAVFLLILVAVSLSCHFAVGQDAPPALVRSYPVRYVPAAQVVEHLNTIMASLRGEATATLDPRTGDVVVQGGEEAQRLAEQLIARVDRPENAAGKIAAGGQPVVEGYGVPQATLPKTLAALRSDFPLVSGAKFAANERSGQIIALAPPDVQVQISQHIAQLQRKFAAEQVAAPSRREKQKIVQDEFHLRHIDAQGLLSGLMSIWGRRLPISTSEDGQVERLRFPAPAGQAVTLEVDRRTNTVTFNGPSGAVYAWRRVVAAVDAPQNDPQKQTAVMPLRYAEREKVEIALAGFRAARREPNAGDLVNMIFQPVAQQEQPAPVAPQPDGEQGEAVQPVPPPLPEEGVDRGVIGPVQIEFLEGLDVILIRGNKRDVERVEKIIQQIEEISAQTKPEVEIYRLEHADNEPVVEVVQGIYDQYFAPRHGPVTITPLVKPNAVLLVGRPEAVDAAKDLIAKVDEPVSPDSQFRVFQLKFLPVQQAETTLTEFYEERGGLGTRVRVSADYRSNSLVVQGSPRDLDEVASMLEQLDVSEIESVNELRVFRLRNSLAEDLAPVIQQAIRGDFNTQTGGGGGAGAQQGGANPEEQIRSTMLTLATVDPQGGRLLRSGVLTDVQVQADVRANALVVRGPGEAMDLIGALIDQLDRLPTEAQIKVFTIVNGDAASLAETLDELFGLQTGQDQFGVAAGAGQGESTLVPLRFSVDLRTNSILASGSGADLEVVEAILLRLDEGDIRERVTVVYRLKNAPAQEVSDAINTLLEQERDVQQLAQGQATPFELIEREVNVVPEPVTNSLIVSASPRYFPEVERIVEQLDERPPMVMIQVLIAEVLLDDTDELGVQLGIEDSLVFDRGVSETLGEGFTVGENLAGQAISDLGLTRLSTLGYGGLVLSAGSDSLNVLIRALQDQQNLQVLSRPQIMTLDNQPAQVQVGEQVPYIAQSTTGAGGVTTSGTSFLETGIILEVIPRIAPDGQVVMQLFTEVSRAGDPSTGVNGTPRIDTTNATTVVSARSGQTVILGGLIRRRTETATHRIPYLSDVPVLGNLFRYDAVAETRSELLFIMTPHIVRTDADIERLKQVESQRMSWCLADVVNVHGNVGLSGAYDMMNPCGGPMTICPDETPFFYPEMAPSPSQMDGAPARPEDLPAPIPTRQGPEMVPDPSTPGTAPEFGGGGPAGTFVQPAGYLRPKQLEPRILVGDRPRRLPPAQ